MNYQIRYVRDLNTLNFFVSLIGKPQRIVVLPDAFIRITRISPRAVLGSTTVTPAEAVALGFIVKDSEVLTDELVIA